MAPRALSRRTLVSYANPGAYAPHCTELLSRVGYEVLDCDRYEQWVEQSDPDDPPRVDLRIVDERRLGELTEEPGERPSPLVVLTGRHGVTGADSRIAAAVKRPAGLHDMFRVVQQVLEESPRSTPRVPTHLRASCARRGREWSGVVLSLSENGCLLRSLEPLPLGSSVKLRFALPPAGSLELEAETAYQLLPDLGLVFSGLPLRTRDAIGAWVLAALAA